MTTPALAALRHLALSERLAGIAEELADHCDAELEAVDDEAEARSILREGLDAGIIDEHCDDFYDEVLDVLATTNGDNTDAR